MSKFAKNFFAFSLLYEKKVVTSLIVSNFETKL